MGEYSQTLKQGAARDSASSCRALSLEMTRGDVPKGYKRTEVGVIPEDWKVAALASLISEISMGPFGSDIKVSNFVSEGVPVLSGFNVQRDKLIDDFSNFVTEGKAKSLKKAVARRGDVVVTHRGTIGQISYIPDDSKYDRYVISQSQFRASFKEMVTPQWVTLYFLSETGSDALLAGKGHTGVPAIAQPTTTFRKLKVPVPSVIEQRAIATALSDSDALIESLDRLIAKKRAIKQAAMQQLLSGRTRLPGFEKKEGLQETNLGAIPQDWNVGRIGEFYDITSSKRVFQDEWATHGVPFYRTREIAILAEQNWVDNDLYISEEMYDEYARK